MSEKHRKKLQEGIQLIRDLHHNLVDLEVILQMELDGNPADSGFTESMEDVKEHWSRFALVKLRRDIEEMKRDALTHQAYLQIGPVTLTRCLPQSVDIDLDTLTFTIKMHGHDPRRTEFARVLMNGGAVKLTVEVES